jgi:hypothetical protein
MSTRRRRPFAALLLSAAALYAAPAAASPDPEPGLRVVKQGNLVWVRSRFSPTQDLVQLIGKGENGQINFDKVFVSPATAGQRIVDLVGSLLVNPNSDESTPWNLNGTYIGANHGCSDARVLTCPGHGLAAADLGSEWTDGAGTRFTVLKIPDADHVWVLSANSAAGDVWRFTGEVKGSALRRSGGGATLPFRSAEMVQLRPACRIRRQEYLVDGETPLAANTPVECRSLDIVEEIDLINPGAVLRDVAGNPGRKRDFAGIGLEAVVANRIVYRFLPNGATVIHHEADAKQEFELGYMGFIQAGPLATPAPLSVRDLYIPGTLPFTRNGRRWDFEGIQNFLAAPPQPLSFSTRQGNVADPARLPDRLVQLLGRKEGDRTAYEVGFAYGYSLTQGMTAPAKRVAHCGEALVLFSSGKSYPRAIDAMANGGRIPAGTRFNCLAYRQYFWPGAFPNATCCYWHPEGDETVLYLAYHKPVERDVIRLPAEFAGRSIRVVEKTPSLVLLSDLTVPADGLAVRSEGRHGALVLAIK